MTTQFDLDLMARSNVLFMSTPRREDFSGLVEAVENHPEFSATTPRRFIFDSHRAGRFMVYRTKKIFGKSVIEYDVREYENNSSEYPATIMGNNFRGYIIRVRNGEIESIIMQHGTNVLPGIAILKTEEYGL